MSFSCKANSGKLAALFIELKAVQRVWNVAMKNWLMLSIIKLLSYLPLSVSRFLGACVGECLWLSNSRSKRVTLKNLELCFPELDQTSRQKMARASLMETSKTGAEAGAIWRRDFNWLQSKIVRTEGEALLREKVAQGKGVLVLAPHHGNWEVVAPYLASIAPLTAMYQPLKSSAMDDLVLSGRSKMNISMAPTNRRGVMMLFKALQQGTIVGILPDQVPERDSAQGIAPFFGQPALTMGLVHGLVQRTGAQVVSVVAQRVAGGFAVVVLDADPAIYSAVAEESLAGMNRSVEACVRLAPTQYQWEYKRFRRLPEGYPRHYR